MINLQFFGGRGSASGANSGGLSHAGSMLNKTVTSNISSGIRHSDKSLISDTLSDLTVGDTVVLINRGFDANGNSTGSSRIDLEVKQNSFSVTQKSNGQTKTSTANSSDSAASAILNFANSTGGQKYMSYEIRRGKNYKGY